MKYDEDVVRLFHKEVYRQQHDEPWFDMTWRGVHLIKNPCDLFVYAELAYKIQPDLIIETGTWMGGSALFWASMCDLNGKGLVITIDTAPVLPLPSHRRLHTILGSSVDQHTLHEVCMLIGPRASVLVNLDSDHKKSHVLAEMEIYGPLVTPGSYMIVEDSNVNGHPVAPEHGPGPWEAIEEYLPNHPEFEQDRDCERYGISFHPGGFLRRVR
jgi:cephalosporin hydroxylase